MGLQHDLGVQGASLFDNFIEIVHLEPENNTMPNRRGVRINQGRVVVFVPGMELKNKLTRLEHPIIEIAMAVLWERVESEQLLIPATTGSDIAYRNQWLGTDSCSLRCRFHHLLLSGRHW